METDVDLAAARKERSRKRQEAYNLRHPGRRAEITAAYRRRHPEKVKASRLASEAKPIAKEKRRLRQKAHVLKTRLRAIEYLGGACQHCGGKFHHSAMDFHHVDPSSKEVKGKGIPSNNSWEKVLKELVKTVLLCANCHRIHHYRERNPECVTIR